MKTILGIFSDREHADLAVNELEESGYKAEDMSIIVKENVYSEDAVPGETVVGNAATGAAKGGILGGIAGLLIGLGIIAIPGIGGLLIGGPIALALGLTGAAATTVSGAATGALAGGLVGALTNLGIPEDIAKTYESRIGEGAVLLAVPLNSETNTSLVEDVYKKHMADQIRTIDGFKSK